MKTFYCFKIDYKDQNTIQTYALVAGIDEKDAESRFRLNNPDC